MVIIKTFQELAAFWKRQKRNWRTVVVRMAFGRFFNRLTMDYNSIYVRELGADPVQLGLVSSFATLASTIMSVPIGWLQDKYSLRKIFLTGLFLLISTPLFYALAQNWVMIIPAVILAALAGGGASCVIICDVSLKNKDRSTGKALCEGYGAIPSLIAPTIATFAITYFGGISSEGIRPLYWISFAARIILFLYVFKQLTEIKRPKAYNAKSSFVESYREVFKRGTALKRWLLFSSINSFTMSMMGPFRQIFAHEIKGADQFILGWMATVTLVVQILFATSLGRLSDRIGRKKTFYLLVPIYCASYVLFAYAPTPELLVASSFLLGFRMIANIVVTSAMSSELVPMDCIGRWRGVLGLITGLVAIPAPIIGGFIWEKLDPIILFLIPIATELLIRLPIIATMPETLTLKSKNP